MKLSYSTTPRRGGRDSILKDVGFASPDDVSIRAAIEANDKFIAALESIRDNAQLTIEHAAAK
jgi:hypothetical protein